MRRVYRSYRELIGILWRASRWIVVVTFACAVVSGFIPPLAAWAGRHVIDDGLRVAEGEMPFSAFTPFLAAMIASAVMPSILRGMIIYGLVQPRVLLILETSYKGEMLQKLKKLRYEHLESEKGMEVIDKAFDRAINSARHMFPMYAFNAVWCFIAASFLLVTFARVSLWFLPTILIPFAAETWWQAKHSYNIYEEMDAYWKRERGYKIPAGFLRNRDYLYEGKLNDSSDFLIDVYEKRLHARNRIYEGFYFKYLRRHFLTGNITKLAVIGNAFLLLYLYLDGLATIGTLAALMPVIFSGIFMYLRMMAGFVPWSGFHIKTLDAYNQFFALSEDEEGIGTPPEHFDIEFRNVRFRYPGTERDILKGLSFYIREGERVSVVGENGEGKSTMIKLLLGLFEPDEGEILLGGRPIDTYSRESRAAVFAPVFQDFTRFSITFKENIAAGNITLLDDDAAIRAAAEKAQAVDFADMDALMGRDFEGGIDLSGGQWQRVALARAFLGDKPILILDEPTSQLDPMAESRLYVEFNTLSRGKTAVFITHRLASTMITDRILVISDGKIAEEGTHEALIARGGIYAEMFEAQKKWYRQEAAS